MFRGVLSNKDCAKFCMRRQHAYWGSRTQGFISHVTDENKALLKRIYKLKCLRHVYLSTFRETCLFSGTLQRLSRAPTPLAQHSKGQSDPVPFPILLPRGSAVPCAPSTTAQLPATPLLALVPTLARFFTTYAIKHTLLHLFKQPGNFRCFYWGGCLCSLHAWCFLLFLNW